MKVRFWSIVELSPSIFVWSFIRAFDQGFRTWRAAGNIDIHGDELVDSLKHRVAAIHSAGRRAGSHGDAPFRLWHLVPDAFHGERHLVGDRAGNDQHITLARGKPHDFHAETGDVEAARRRRHQLDRAAGKAHRHRPERVFPHPVDGGVHAGDDHIALDLRIVGRVEGAGSRADHGAELLGKLCARQAGASSRL